MKAELDKPITELLFLNPFRYEVVSWKLHPNYVKAYLHRGNAMHSLYNVTPPGELTCEFPSDYRHEGASVR